MPSDGFPNRDAFYAYVDKLSIPDTWKYALKQGTSSVSGKYINNMPSYLKLSGEPCKALCVRYGLSANVGYDGVELGAPIEKAVNDLIVAGDALNGDCNNSCWYNKEQGEKGGDWSWEAPKNLGLRAVLDQAAHVADPAGGKSDTDTGGR